MNELKGVMVQYGLWPNCPNSCEFCLLKDKTFIDDDAKIQLLDNVITNVKTVDWKNKFSAGISLLGGEVYYVKNPEVQDKFMELVDVIIEYVLKVSNNPICRYSTVTNGLYEPSFLYRVVDRIRDAVGMDYVDINFSYDFSYRFKSEAARKLVLKNVNDFHKRYDYRVGVQAILTQHIINEWKAGRFKVSRFLEEEIPGNALSFLYPHKPHTEKRLENFYFNRRDLLEFLVDLRSDSYETYVNFINSTKNSERFKYSGLYVRNRADGMNWDLEQDPVLSDGKEVKTSCGHSELYRCYADSDKCLLCDIMAVDGDL